MKTRSLLAKLAKKYPKSIAKKYHDFAGLQVGKIRENTKTIFLCLDFDYETFNYLKNNDLISKIDLVITHHPFIYGTFAKVINNDEIKKSLVEDVLKNNLTIYSYHTNFDEGKDGMNDALAEKLGLLSIASMPSNSMGRGGELAKEMDVKEFANYARKALNVDYSFLINCGKERIKRVAIVGGGGWYIYKDAIKDGYDLFISGDIPHHGRRDVISYKYNYLDMPHEIESIFVDQMEKVLKEIDPSFVIYKIKHEKLPILIQ